MKIATVDFPGPNGIEEIDAVCARFGHEVVRFGPKDTSFKDAEALILPGGYSYGDVIRPAAVAQTCQVCGAIGRFAESGKPVLGIGNGFQLLCEIDVLPGILLRNSSLEFTAGVIGVRVESKDSLFTQNLDATTVLKLPLACYYGQYCVDSRKRKYLEKNDLVALRYVDRFGDSDVGVSFLGSVSNIAGVFSEKRNVLGMMVHPERAVDGTGEQADGLAFFKSWFESLA